MTLENKAYVTKYILETLTVLIHYLILHRQYQRNQYHIQKYQAY